MSNHTTTVLGEPGTRRRGGALLSELELGAWRGLLRVHAAVTKQLDAELIAAHDLPLSSYEVLLALAGAPDACMRMSELAESVLLSRSGLTRLVDRLERDALVTRRACSNDARGQHACITEKGRRLFHAARKTHLSGVRERFLENFDDAELARLGAAWNVVVPGAAAPSD